LTEPNIAFFLKSYTILSRKGYTLSHMRNIVSSRIPCWYELSWRPVIGIILRIHQDFATGINPIPQDSLILEHFKKDFGFKEFGGEFGKDFGYEHSLKFLGQVDQFLEYHVPACLCRKLSDVKCRGCEGTGNNEDFEDKCLYCDGEGREVVCDYKEAYAVSASLSTLFNYMRFPEIETSATNSQLMCIYTATIKDLHGGSIDGEYGEDVVNFLRKRSAGRIPEMIEAMRGVWLKMEGRVPSFYDHSFEAYTQGDGGWLSTNCPGNACGLDPAHGSIGRHRGYKFSCHNADGPIQQLAMLGSLASLQDLVRSNKK